MKFVIFNGSPAGIHSNTHVITAAFLHGAQKAGAETETVFLAKQQIRHCKGCFACWFQTPGKCILEDDMAELLFQYRTADIVGFATPVYTWNMTAMLKNFVDRLAPLKVPQVIQTDHDFDLADAVPKKQQFIVISNCGFPGSNNFGTMKTVFASCDPVLEIYRNCGKLLKSRESRVQKVVAQYLQIVEQAGYELASQKIVSEQTKLQLQMELMPVQEYVQYIGITNIGMTSSSSGQ